MPMGSLSTALMLLSVDSKKRLCFEMVWNFVYSMSVLPSIFPSLRRTDCANQLYWTKISHTEHTDQSYWTQIKHTEHTRFVHRFDWCPSCDDLSFKRIEFAKYNTLCFSLFYRLLCDLRYSFSNDEWGVSWNRTRAIGSRWVFTVAETGDSSSNAMRLKTSDHILLTHSVQLF